MRKYCEKWPNMAQLRLQTKKQPLLDGIRETLSLLRKERQTQCNIRKPTQVSSITLKPQVKVGLTRVWGRNPRVLLRLRVPCRGHLEACLVVSFDQGSGMKLWHRRRNYHAGIHYIILNGEMTPLGRRSAPVWRNLRGKGGFTNFLLVAGGVPIPCWLLVGLEG